MGINTNAFKCTNCGTGMVWWSSEPDGTLCGECAERKKWMAFKEACDDVDKLLKWAFFYYPLLYDYIKKSEKKFEA